MRILVRDVCKQLNFDERDGMERSVQGEGKGERGTGLMLRLVATKPVAKGERLEMACNKRFLNEELLCNYGFVDVESRRERLHLQFHVGVGVRVCGWVDRASTFWLRLDVACVLVGGIHSRLFGSE